MIYVFGLPIIIFLFVLVYWDMHRDRQWLYPPVSVWEAVKAYWDEAYKGLNTVYPPLYGDPA